MRIGLPVFIIPFAFVYNPALVLVGTWSDVLPNALLALAGVVFFAAGTAGHLRAPLGRTGRAVLVVGGAALLWPKLVVALCGLAACLGVLLWQTLRGAPTA